jgi:hypothetical protein
MHLPRSHATEAVRTLVLAATLPLLGPACDHTSTDPGSAAGAVGADTAQRFDPTDPDALLPNLESLPGEANPILIESVIGQHADAIKTVPSLYADFTWTETSVEPEIPLPTGGAVPGGRRTVEGAAKLWQQGANYHQDLSQHIVWHDAGKQRKERLIAVLNNNYFAEFHEPVKLLTLYRLGSPQSYGPVDSALASYPRPNILHYGFRPLWSSLEQQYRTSISQFPGSHTWTIARESSGNDTCYRLRNFQTIESEPWLLEEFLVDADRGFLLSDYRAYRKEGTLWTSVLCQLEEVATGVWFPMAIKHYSSESAFTREIRVNDIKIGETLDDVFRLEKMAFNPADVTMTEYSPGGKTRTVKGFWNGQWMALAKIPGRGRQWKSVEEFPAYFEDLHDGNQPDAVISRH